MFHCFSLYTSVRRGQPVWPYAVSADERILEMDYDRLVYEKNSSFQNIRIFHSKECGNVLILDGDASMCDIHVVSALKLISLVQLLQA